MKNIFSNLFNNNNNSEERSKMLYLVIKKENKYNIVVKNNYLLLENKSILPSVERIILNDNFVSDKSSFYIYIDTNKENLLKKKI